MQQSNSQLEPDKRKYIRLVQVFGILHVINSLLIFAFGVVVLAEFDLRRELNAQASSIWSTPFFLTTGVLGIIIFFKPHNGPLLTTHSIFAITSSVFAAIIFATSAYGIKFYNCESRLEYFPSYDYYSKKVVYHYFKYYEPYDCLRKTIRNIGQPMYGMLVALSFIEVIFSIVSAVYSFKIYNCCSNGCAGGCCDCENDCQCCCDPQVQPNQQMYQMQPYPPNQPYNPYFQPQYPNPTYIQQIGNQQAVGPSMQLGQIFTNSSGQQFVLIPVSQFQTVASVARVSTTVSDERRDGQEEPLVYPQSIVT